MTQMSYASFGVTAPGPNTTAGYGFFKPAFDGVFSAFNPVETIVAGRTSDATALMLVQRNSSGGANFSGTVGMNAFTTTGNGSVNGTFGAVGAATFGSTLVATGDITAPNFHGTFVGTASSALALDGAAVVGGAQVGLHSLPISRILDGAVYQSGPTANTTITFAAVGYYNSLGAYTTYNGGAYTYASGDLLNAHPRWDLFYLDDTGARGVVFGDASGTLTKPTRVGGQYTLCLVYVPVACTSIVNQDNFTGATGQGYILPAPAYLSSFASTALLTSATAHATVSGGSLATLVVDTPGSGYTIAPSVSFTGGTGTGAAATATLMGGTVTGLTITNAGSGYGATAPTVVLSTSTASSRAAIGAAASGGNADITAMTALTSVTQSVGFTGTQTFFPGATGNSAVIVKGLGGQTAALWQAQTSAAAVVGEWNVDGRLGQGGVALAQAGFTQAGTFSPAAQASVQGINQQQTLKPTAAGGNMVFGAFGQAIDTSAAGVTTAASANANLGSGGTAGQVISVTGLLGGSGYGTTPPIITFVGPCLAPATATAVLTGGVVTGITGLSGGVGYTVAPTVVFSTVTASYGLLTRAYSLTAGSAPVTAYGAFFNAPTIGANNLALGVQGASGLLRAWDGGAIANPTLWANSPVTMGKVSTDMSTTFTANFQMNVNAATGSGAGWSAAQYEKGAVYAEAWTVDQSPTGEHGVVGVDARGYIQNGNPLGEAWGLVTAGFIWGLSPGTTDGFIVGAEIQSQNFLGSDQANIDTTTSKYGAHIVAAGNTNSTAALYINGASPTQWHKGVIAYPTAFVGATNDTFLELIGLFAVKPSGHMSIGGVAGTHWLDVIGEAAPTLDLAHFDASALTNAQIVRIDKAGHVRTTQALAPTFTAGTGAGTTPTIVITGTDQCGVIALTTGTTPASGNATILTVAFRNAWGTTPNGVMLTPSNAVAVALAGAFKPYVNDASTTTAQFVIIGGTSALAAGTAYRWIYSVA